MNNGFIKLFRCIEDSFFWNDSEAVHLWIQLLVSANHKDKEILLSGKKETIKSGQFVCSRNTLSLKTGIKESKIQRLLKLFENEQQIEQQMNSKFRIISILNWHKYQSSEQANEQQMNSKRTADEQQMNTNNNDKNDKNEKNDKKEEKESNDSKKKPDRLLDVYFQFILLGLTPEKATEKAIAFYNHYQSNGWKVGRHPMKSWISACSGTWMSGETRAVGYHKDYLIEIVDELKRYYCEKNELDPYDFKTLVKTKPELFQDQYCFSDNWLKYLEGIR